MLKNLTSIKLQGNNFDSETVLQLFPYKVPKEEKEEKKDKKEISVTRISLIYGKNGSGKSTIATAFNKIKGDDIRDITTAELIDKDNNVTNDDKNNIFVFDETYIDNNIRIKEDGLDTIVMLGEMKDIEEKLEKAEKEKNKLEEEKKLQDKICEVLDDKEENYKNEKAPRYWLNKMMNNLKGQDDKGNKNWAERDFEIRQIAGENPRKATSVNDDKYKDFINLSPKKSRDDLIIEYKNLLEELKIAQSGTKTITTEVKRDYSFDFDENNFIDLLSKKIEKPTLSEREEFLFSVMLERKEQHLNDITDYFSKTENNQCPFCTQEVSSTHKQELFASIEKILSKASEEYKQELQAYKREEITINFNDFSVLDETVFNECQTVLQQFNDLVQLVNQKIDEKIDNVYQSISFEKIDILSQFNLLKSKLDKLEQLRIEHNQKSIDINPIKNQLNSINNDIAYYDICDEYKKFIEKSNNKKTEDDKLQKIKEELEKCGKICEELKAKKRNIKIAMEEINKGLQYIFFADNRLTLEYHNEKYCLKSMGKDVTPDRISTGERNAIAMCYFFSQLMQNKEKGKGYSEPYLLVIDDPVSSFDLENRIGLLSFLRYQLKQYMCGNENTKAVILTHDIQTYFDLQKVATEIVDYFPKISGYKYIFSLLELKGRKIVDFSFRNRHEYTKLLEEIYDFALNANQDLSITIGNTMRRTLEAYGSFIYKKGIEKISTDNKILSIIQDSQIVPYFENFMYRLVLHGESHFEEKTKSMHDDLHFFQFVSDEEKQRTAQFVICFLYCLNKLHILTHLGEDKENQIKQWIEEIKRTKYMKITFK